MVDLATYRAAIGCFISSGIRAEKCLRRRSREEKRKRRLEKEYTALKSKENEDQIELRRLRTENRLLRQRIDNLEKESASLADCLIQYQLTRAQEAEETYALKNELSLTKHKRAQSEKRLKEVEALLGDIKERTDSINSAGSLDEEAADKVIQGLQEELIFVRLRDVDNAATMKTLRSNIDDLQQWNLQLQHAPSNDVQCLQEELIAVKLREAEANLSLKEMRQTITDLETDWQKHLVDSAQSSPKEKNSKSEMRVSLKKTQEELMSLKLREAAVLSHLKDVKQRVMELETQNQICTNQIRRMDEENKLQKCQLGEAATHADHQEKQLKNLLRKLDDLETKRKEESMMARIREAEKDQLIGELKQKIAAMDIQKEEVLVADRLESKGGNQDLANTIFDLQEEVLQLKLSASPKSPHVSPQIASNKGDEDDYYDDDEDIEDPEMLNRTLSDIIEGKRSSTSLLALLNKDDSTDCDSVQSSSSENSSSGQKLETLYSKDMTGCRSKTEGTKVVRIASDELVNNCDTDNSSSKINASAIDQSGSKNRTLQTGSVNDGESGNSNVVISANQSSSNEISILVNGDSVLGSGDKVCRMDKDICFETDSIDKDLGLETDSNDNVDTSKRKTTDNDHLADTTSISASNGS